ncbi:G-protein coupled receptor 124-like [Sinocyclocheilus grahami]|uniref:G-protein coupled receptor 124-like n=1 Tax=Sinocyclocheilus grahami TaxID=75366 RepID=UPI0007AD2FC0|nr:PREDICTED: G-protein coupled receptor 124-like [Sinocyclocheilus grahami]
MSNLLKSNRILSNNKISALKNNSFLGLRALERLDLGSNLISRIAPGAFHGLTALRRLDLSNNRIGCFSADMFLDLGRVSKLNLSGNIFSTLPGGLFTHVPSLRALHVGTDYLFCDCQLRWLLSWIRSQAVRVGNESVCVYPTRLRGLELRSLQEQQLTCDGPLELPVLQLIPTQRQLVFRGDRLPLQCAASFLDPTVRLSWSHEQRPVHTLEHRGLYVEDSIIHDCCLITSCHSVSGEYEDTQDRLSFLLSIFCRSFQESFLQGTSAVAQPQLFRVLSEPYVLQMGQSLVLPLAGPRVRGHSSGL